MERSELTTRLQSAEHPALLAAGSVVAGIGFVVLCLALPLTLALAAVLLAMRALVQTVIRSLSGWRARRLLGEDWWPRFERDLQSYMDPGWSRARHRERRL